VTPRKQALPNEATLFLSIACASYYCAACENENTLSICAKVASTLLLTLYRHQTKHPMEAHTFTLSLAAHAAGDLLIELSKETFVLSLAAFFIGHAFYLQQLNAQRIAFLALNKTQITCISLLALYALWFTHLLTSKTDGIIQAAIPLYCTMLFFIVTFATMQKERLLSACLFSGLYAASDNLIGLHMFLPETFNRFSSLLPDLLKPASRITFPLYFAGQVGSVERAKHTNTRNPAPMHDNRAYQ